MTVDIEKLQRLFERIQSSTRRNFARLVGDLFHYLDETVPANDTYRQFEAERHSKWSKWGPQRLGDWEMPATKDDRMSLAWDLYRSAAEQGEEGNGLSFRMYAGNFNENIANFNDDFLAYMQDAVNAVLSKELPPTGAESFREKQQKFGILDAPNLLQEDLVARPGIFGRVVIYFDLDNFKAFNTQFTERKVDQALLPDVQRLVAQSVQNNGHAYAEGGDEMIVLLPNASPDHGIAFAVALRRLLAAHSFNIDDSAVALTASFGVAASATISGSDLADHANAAKAFAKTQGKNCVALYRETGCVVVSETGETPMCSDQKNME
jgi:diguanylate cyclase (GGDEF)-like protein